MPEDTGLCLQKAAIALSALTARDVADSVQFFFTSVVPACVVFD